MKPLRDHPALDVENRREAFAPMHDIHRLAVHLRHLLSLDPTAVYMEKANSTIVYYESEFSKSPGVARIVLAPDGTHRRIGPVGFDPRTKEA